MGDMQHARRDAFQAASVPGAAPRESVEMTNKQRTTNEVKKKVMAGRS
jgi:hypothetical protein